MRLNISPKKITAIFFYCIVAIIAIYLVFLGVDRIDGRQKKSVSLNDSIEISCGDIIFKISSFILADSHHPEKGCLPGHLGIVLNDTIIVVSDQCMKNIRVAESSLFNIKEKRFSSIARINSANCNYEYAIGRLILIKTHLNPIQKLRLAKYVESNLGKPYRLFAKKKDTSCFNCSSYVWHALMYAADMDVDSNGGEYVLPADILIYFLNDEKVEVIKI